jgi:hypothetical protein
MRGMTEDCRLFYFFLLKYILAHNVHEKPLAQRFVISL